jgi:DNA primase
MTPVEEIKERLNIVEVVGEYVPLKKAGANHKGRCPFHNEKTPSFTVSESKQFFHCFGCSKGGDIFTFVQEVEGVEFAEALRMLAAKAGVQLRAVNPREQNENTRLLDALAAAADFFRSALRQSAEGEKARGYLAERSVAAETQEQFQIGYSPDSWDALLTVLKQRGFREKEIERAGLAIPSPKTGGVYDRFRGRLMFPIHNAHGNVIGFGGRTLDPAQKEAKYINSPQTAVYNKSAVLYGLHLAKPFIKKMDATVIVEGYMDVVTAHQAKFRNVVAASGTALTEDQVRLLKRYSPNVILAFDADAAGLNAAWRGMQVAVEQGMNIKILVLPKGQDPDDLIRQNPGEFRERALAAKPFMDYAFDTVMAPLTLTNVQHKKKAAAELLPMIAKFPDPIERAHYTTKLAEALAVGEEVLQAKLEQLRPPFPGKRPAAGVPNQSATKPAATGRGSKGGRAHSESDLLVLTSERLVALISVQPELLAEAAVRLQPEHLAGDAAPALYKQIQNEYNQHGKLQSDALVITHEPLRARWLELQLIGEELYGQLDAAQRQQELLALLESLERHRIKARLAAVQHELSQAEHANNTSAITQLSEEIRSLTGALKNF